MEARGWFLTMYRHLLAAVLYDLDVALLLRQMRTVLLRLRESLWSTMDQNFGYFRKLPPGGSTLPPVHVDPFGAYTDMEPRDYRRWFDAWTLQRLVESAFDRVLRATRRGEDGLPRLAVDDQGLTRILAELGQVNAMLLGQLARGGLATVQHASNGGRVRAESRKVSPAVRETCQLRARGMSYSEIARQLGESRGTIKKRCQRNPGLVEHFRRKL